jgi:pimeloyl-ACP methyl ester carboxylesterase
MKALKSGQTTSSTLRERALAGLPVVERRLRLANITTPVLDGGDGPPIILLHGPAAHAGHWMLVIPLLVERYRVIVPDLPGHGDSVVQGGLPDAERILSWLDELIEQTCASPPVIVGQLLGGAVAACYAAGNGGGLRGLVLVDTLGLRSFQPTPEFGEAIARFLGDPTPRTHRTLWQYCAFDLERLHERMADRWESFEAYNLDRAASPDVRKAVSALMELFAVPAMPADMLARISVPTSLIWGRHDRGTPLSVAEKAGNRFGWPLRVIEECADDPPIERPRALVEALLETIGT